MIELQVYFEGAVKAIPSYIYGSLIAVLVVCLIGFVTWKGLKVGLRYTSQLLLLTWICLVLGTAVVFRGDCSERGYSLIPFISYFEYGENSYFMEHFAINMLNVALFVPIGFFAGLAIKNISWRKILQLGFSLSLTIELLQFVFKKGYAEVDDLIHNVAGCLLGFAIYKLFAAVFRFLHKYRTGSQQKKCSGVRQNRRWLNSISK